ncbi:MAG: Cys-Gln thioester bond-forming surface protein [Bacteroidetes bacterium]|nr:Cys-Gln thioester bond-forming surface protein [Bacteroidota bacterium]
MKKFIYPLLLVIMTIFVANKGYSENGCSVMALTSLAEGTSGLTITNPLTHNPETVFAGCVNATVDGHTTKVYCIDLNHGVSVPSSNFNDSGFAQSEVAWILTNYFPYKTYPYAGSLSTVNKEAAAIQLAIWYFTDGLDYNTLVGNVDIRDRAKAIVDEALLHGTFQPYSPLSIVPISVLNNCSIKDTIKARVVDELGNGVSGKTLTVTVSAGGSVTPLSVTTGAGGYTQPIIVTKGGANTTVTISGSLLLPPGIRFLNISAPLTTQHMGNGKLVEGCYSQKITLHCDTTSSGNNGGVETNYNMAEALLKRHTLIQNGETTPLIANQDFVFPPAYSLSQLAPNPGPFNTTRVETTPFDILGISNATSAYAADYKYGSTRLGAIFSTTTNAPEVYSHSKPACDRLAKMSMNQLEVKYIDGHQFYLAQLYNPSKNYTDYTILFSVYESASGFTVDNKWTIQEYIVPPGTLTVYNYQVWAASPEAAVELTRSVLAKFAGYKPVSYPTVALKSPDIVIKSSQYTNDGKLRMTVKNNFGTNQTVQLTIKYIPQQGMPEQTLNQNINLVPGENSVIIPTGYISSASVFLTQSNGFKDAVFVGGGIYGSYAGPLSTVTEFSFFQASAPSLPNNSFLFPGGVRMKGNLGDKVYISRSIDGAFEGVDLRNFLKLRFEAMGSGTLSVYLEAKQNGQYVYPFVNVPLTSSFTTKEIDLTQFKINNQPVDLSSVTLINFQLSKQYNTGMNGFDFSIRNAGIIANSVGIGSNGSTVTDYSLAQNYPNPFNPATTISFSIPKQDFVSLKVYNTLGKEVATLVSEVKPTGVYDVTFDASTLSSGVYFYKLETSSFSEVKRMVLMK